MVTEANILILQQQRLWSSGQPNQHLVLAEGQGKDGSPCNPTTHRTHSDHHPELEAALTHWVEQQEAKLLPIKGRLIKVKAERLVKAFTIFVHLFLLFLGHFLYMYIFLNAYTFAVSQPHTFRQLLL